MYFKLLYIDKSIPAEIPENMILLKPFSAISAQTLVSENGRFATVLSPDVDFDLLVSTLCSKNYFRVGSNPVCFHTLQPGDAKQLLQQWERLKLPQLTLVSLQADVVLQGAMGSIRNALRTFLFGGSPGEDKYVILDDLQSQDIEAFGSMEQSVFSLEEKKLLFAYNVQAGNNLILQDQLERQRQLSGVYEDSLDAIREEHSKEINWYKSERDTLLTELDKVREWAKKEIEKNYDQVIAEANKAVEAHADEVKKIQQWAETSIDNKDQELANMKTWAQQEIEKINTWANEVNANARQEIEKVTAWANEVETKAQQEIEKIKTWADEEVDKIKKWASEEIATKKKAGK